GEFGQGALGFREPGAAGGQRLLSLADAGGVATGLSLGELRLQGRDRVPQLLDRALSPRERLGGGPLPLRGPRPPPGLPRAPAAARPAPSTRRSPCSSWSRDSRGTGPACSHRSWMPRSADRDARQSVIGSSACASASSDSLTAACPRSSVSLAANTSERAA